MKMASLQAKPLQQLKDLAKVLIWPNLVPRWGKAWVSCHHEDGVGLSATEQADPSNVKMNRVVPALQPIHDVQAGKLGVAELTTTLLTLTMSGILSESSAAGGKNPRIARLVAAVVLLVVGVFLRVVLLRIDFSIPLFYRRSLCPRFRRMDLFFFREMNPVGNVK